MKYRFQNYLELVIRANGHTQFDQYFENEYARIDQTYMSDGEAAARVTLEIVDEIPADLPNDAVRREVRFKRLFTFEYAVVGHGTPDATIYFKDHPVRNIYVTAVGVFVQAQVLEPVMYLSFLNQGILFMHSAGVSKDGQGYVFPAYGGTGKTTTSLSLMNQGYDFLGDDLLIVDPDKGKVFPYPRPLHVFTYNVQNLRGANIPRTTVAIIYFKNVLRAILETALRNEFLISTRVHADEILPNLKLSDPVALHSIVFLKKEGGHETVELDSNEIISTHARAIVESADLNESLFEILDNEEASAAIRKLEIEVASTMLAKANYFGYLNTRLIDLDTVADYLTDVEVGMT